MFIISATKSHRWDHTNTATEIVLTWENMLEQTGVRQSAFAERRTCTRAVCRLGVVAEPHVPVEPA